MGSRRATRFPPTCGRASTTTTPTVVGVTGARLTSTTWASTRRPDLRSSARRRLSTRLSAGPRRQHPRLARSLRPQGEGPPRRRGAGHLLALRRRDVDHRLHDDLHPLETALAGSVAGL